MGLKCTILQLCITFELSNKLRDNDLFRMLYFCKRKYCSVQKERGNCTVMRSKQ